MNNFLSTIFTSAANVLLTAAQGIVISRILGPSGRGEFQAIIFFPTIIASVGLLGLNDSIVRLVARSSADSNKSFFIPVLKASVISGLLSTLVGWGAVWHLDRFTNLSIPSYLFFLFIPINHMGICLLSIDYGRSNYSSYNFGRILLTPVFILVAFISFYFLPISAFSISLSLLISNGVVLLQRLMGFRNELSRLPACSIIELFTAGRSFWIASLLSIFLTQIDKALLISYFDSQSVGIYVVAFSVSSILGLISTSVATVVFQKSAASSSVSSSLVIFRAFRMCAIVSFIVLIFASPFLDRLVELVYGVEFSNSGIFAVYLLPAVLIQSLADILSQYLRGQGRPILVAVGAVLSLVCTTLLVSVFHDIFGLSALPASLAISNFLMLNWLAWGCVSKGRFNISVLIPTTTDFQYILNAALDFKVTLSKKK